MEYKALAMTNPIPLYPPLLKGELKGDFPSLRKGERQEDFIPFWRAGRKEKGSGKARDRKVAPTIFLFGNLGFQIILQDWVFFDF